MITHD